MPLPGFDVLTALQPVRRTLGLSRMVRWTTRGLIAGGAAATLLLLLAHLHPIALAIPAAIGLVAVGLVAGVAFGLRSWPGPLEAARLADRHFGLADRLTTALELRGTATPVSQLQRESTLHSVDGLALQQSGRFYPRRSELGLAALAVIAIVTLSLWAIPASTSATSSDLHGQQLIKKAANKVPELTKKAHEGLTTQKIDPAALKKLDAALAHLRQQLLKTQSRSQALRAISLTQQQIHRIAAGLHPLSSHAVAGLNHSLSGNMTPQERSLASKPSTALSATARALNRLASQIAHMTPAQRAQLAKALARAANATGDSSMRAALHQAASSLGYDDSQTAAQSLRQAATLAQNGKAATAARQRLAQTSSSLASLKDGIAGLAGKPGNAQGAPGNGQGGESGSGRGSAQGGGKGSGKGTGKGSGNGSGKGARKGSGQGSGKGSGKGNGHGSGSGQGNSHGSGSGSGQGSSNRGTGGSGGHGLGGGHGNNGPTGNGRYATVYIPGQERNGPKTSSKGPSGAPSHGGIVPYRQVVGAYTNEARAALGNSALTPAQRATVQRYFSRISR